MDLYSIFSFAGVIKLAGEKGLSILKSSTFYINVKYFGVKEH